MNYTYENGLVSKKQLKQLLSWTFTKYGSIKACFLADKLKTLGFKYATQAGISISIEDLRVPSAKKAMLYSATQEIINSEKICLKGKMTSVEKLQKIIDTWNITSELLKDEVVSYFKTYDPLNSVYIMAFSGARGNLSQVRQLVGMRGLMSDPSGQILDLPIKKNFREGLTITDYLISGYGARKGIVDTALKTANSGYLTRRLIDVAQDIIIREKDCLTNHSFLFRNNLEHSSYEKILGCLINKPVYDPQTNELIAELNTQITLNLIRTFKQKNIKQFYIRSPLTCSLYRSICQKCYGWDLASENLVDIGEAIGIIAGQSIGEPGTQLTMRTFHTGGVFTSQIDQQLISPIKGTIKFSEMLKTSTIRTNRGENVLLTEGSGTLSINSKHEIIELELPRNTILFVTNKQFIKQKHIIGQLTTSTKQTRKEVKYVLSDSAGQIYMPKFKNRRTSVTQNKLLWILSGQVYESPTSSFLNFWSDYKIDKNNYIFRSKLINEYSGSINLISSKSNLFDQFIEIESRIDCFEQSKIQKICPSVNDDEYLLVINNNRYLIKLKSINSQSYISNIYQKYFATRITNRFTTLIGGYPIYNIEFNQKEVLYIDNLVFFIRDIRKRNYRTITWVPEETHDLDPENNTLLIELNTFINRNIQIATNVYSKTSGIITLDEENNDIKTISIKPGLVYNAKDLESLANKMFYPGEIILETIHISQLSVCEIIETGLYPQLLVRPLEIYEVPFSRNRIKNYRRGNKLNTTFSINDNFSYLYESRKKIKSANQLNLITNNLEIKLQQLSNKNSCFDIRVNGNKNKMLVNFVLCQKLNLLNYLPPHVKYTDIKSCLLVEPNQFVNTQIILLYLEALTSKSLKIVEFKSKKKENKQIFLISNNDCLIIEKEKIKNKRVNDFLTKEVDVYETGKIIMDNGKYLTVQRGKPYFFPQCKNEQFIKNTELKYRYIPNNLKMVNPILNQYRNIHINYLQHTNKISPHFVFSKHSKNFEFPKILIKKQGKYYSAGIPIFIREFLINKKNNDNAEQLTKFTTRRNVSVRKACIKNGLPTVRILNGDEFFDSTEVYDFMLFLRNSELINQPFKGKRNLHAEMASVSLIEYPLKTIGIHSITEDYFEQEVNSVFCKDNQFIGKGQTIGLLNFEREITGDIVQGLPRIEELLEARKKKKESKNTPKSLKKDLLISKTTIDPAYQFRKMGTTIKEKSKINPHTFLRIYFYYYAKKKFMVSDNKSELIKYCFTNNYEASYRSFKKIQTLILNSVQSVYRSQGVMIANKHLELIIKQMTTKVLITHEGETPLLPHEVIDLYHIKYINKIIKIQNKQIAAFVPLLLGITKAALNNPSFISAASFQETTRVLTKAAIEGNLDWLRGLKENIIIGHLIPAGTGSKNYSDSFNINSYYLKKSYSKYKSEYYKNI